MSSVSQSSWKLNCIPLKHIHVSLQYKTAIETHESIKSSIRSSISEVSKARLAALSSLLDELTVHKVLPFDVAFDEYSAKVPSVANANDQKSAKVQFRHLLLSPRGIPVFILQNRGKRFECLLEKQNEHIDLLRALDEVLIDVSDDESAPFVPEILAANIPTLLKLMSSSRDRAILQFLLCSIFSNTRLHQLLGYTSSTVNNIKTQVNSFLIQAELSEAQSQQQAEEKITSTILRLEEIIEEKENLLERKRKRLAEEEEEDQNYDLQLKRQRVMKLKNRPVKLKKRIAQRHFHSWKQSLKSQKGKNKGNYRIDRRAEKAISDVLEEQLKAHHRRWGDEGTGYLESDGKRLHKRDMRRIANKFLAAHGKRLIKSSETVRSWGRCRSKRSRQAKQHRGRNFWSHVRSQKTLKQRHINIHYNRAHIKNYTRLGFGDNMNYRDLVIRRAIDDKAYVRCGTSEGFSRPVHCPLQVSEEPFNLPTSDYPDNVGYVSPGVILIIKDMQEIEHQGRDKYTTTDQTVTVTCKPKYIYPSTATNWQNDLFAVRYLYRDEHEVKGDSIITDGMSHCIVSFLVWLRDSLLQYELMSLPEDYLRIVEGGDHLEREVRRNTVLHKRLQECLATLDVSDVSSQPLAKEIKSKIEEAQHKVKEILLFLDDSKPFVNNEIVQKNSTAVACCKELRLYLENNGLPKHRPIDIQTSDAGPGVSSHERITQLRLAESFMINGLDIQCRFHYAPGDSASHVAEKVMRSLNECLGDGRAIPIQYGQESLLTDDGKAALHDISREEVNRVLSERSENAAKKCALDVSSRYDGKPCMGTSIHSTTPSYDLHRQFFFDDDFMSKCLNANSPALLSKCAGKEYFRYVQKFFQDHYYVYDNGCEGIRNGCTEGKKDMCSFHKFTETADILENGWKGRPFIHRVPPPVPDYSYEDEFHYCTMKQVLEGDVTEKFGPLKEIVKNTCLRVLDDYSPRKQLEKMMERCGEPILETTEEVHSDGSVSLSVVDSNNTLQKYQSNVDSFVKEFVGEDLRSATENELKRRYDLKVKAAVSKKTTANTRALEKAKTYDEINWSNHISSNTLDKLYVSQLHLYLTQQMGLSKSQCEAKGYTKAKKVEDIKKHFYTCSSIKEQSNAKTTSPLLKSSTTSISLPHTVRTQPPCQSLRVPPWGGAVYNSNSAVRSLRNTCPIDNFLTIFYVLMTDFNAFYLQLHGSVDSYATELIRIKHLFDQGHHADGKLCWISLFQGRFSLTLPILDLWGNEEDMFISRLQPTASSKYSGTCSSHACPCPTKDFISYSVSLSDVGVPPPALVQYSLDDWMATDTRQSTCGLTLRQIVPGTPHYLGVVNHVNPTSGQIIQQYQYYCGGKRSFTKREFVVGVPLFFPISLEFFAQRGIITDATQIPLFVVMKGERFNLMGMTFYNGQHYRGAVKRCDQAWYQYDGLWERNCPGTGLQRGALSTPAGYIPSSCFYVHSKFV